ncbi:MAG TPA: hypothetical protein VGN42_08940 [Pirellulales bacterium]|nr:hypothetical protein [Pirellulales bacterium]
MATDDFLRSSAGLLLASTCGAVIGALLGLLSEGVAGAGHASPIPLALYLGMAAYFPETPSQFACAGGAIYGIYAAILCLLRRRRARTTAGWAVLTCHYLSVALLVWCWWPLLSYETVTRLSRSWHYARFEFSQSVILFIIANGAAIGMNREGRGRN